MKKISLFLAILMLMQCFLLVACKSKDNQETTPAETTQPSVEPDNNVKVFAADISKYSLICAQRSSASVMGQFWQLQSQIGQMYGTEPAAETDYAEESEYEILIGDTNREESQAFLEGLLWDDYGYTIIGNKIVIAGHTAEGTLAAIKHILEHIKSGDHTEVFFSNKNQLLYRYPYVSDTFLVNGIDVSRAKIVVNGSDSDKQIAQVLSDKSLELCGRRPEIVTDETLILKSDPLIIIGASKYVPADMQAEWDAAQESGEGQFSYYINNTENILWINTIVLEGYSAINRDILPLVQSNSTANLAFEAGLVKVPELFSVMSFNVYVSSFNNQRTQRVVDTILENTPSVFGVQEASDGWMSALESKLADSYASVGVGRDAYGYGEHSAIFYRTDKFTFIEGGTKWLSDTPDKAASYYYYTDPETGITHYANFPRIMTYVVLERKSDGVRFLYVNTHLDHNGDNSQEVAEKVRQGQIEILISQIKATCEAFGNLPTIVTGDFNVTPVASAYTTMIGAGFLDSSKVAKQSEIKPTYNGMNDSYEGAIIDYIFVSPELANVVDTYTVCPAKRNGQWISDHNAIIATITLPTPEAE